MRFLRIVIVWTLLLWTVLPARGEQVVRPNDLLLRHVFTFRHRVDSTLVDDSVTYAYRKFSLNVRRRNIAILPVPTMFDIAHGKQRQYIEESYERITLMPNGKFDTRNLLLLSTIPKKKTTMNTLRRYMTPTLYEETLFEEYILSPFHQANKKFYKYSFMYLRNRQVRIDFKPKIDNTQLVTGYANVDTYTGRIINGVLKGEFDMVDYMVRFTMGEKGMGALLATRCQLYSNFKFLGNNIIASQTIVYGLKREMPDTLYNKEDPLLMALVRQDSLSLPERATYDRYYAEQGQTDTLQNEKKHWTETGFWNFVGDNMLNKITSNYGSSEQGHMRINPLFNPLYMGYSGRKGYYYKFDMRNQYNFTDNSYLYARFKAGYSFKQKQLYFNLPVVLCFNQERHGYVQFYLSNGNRIANGKIKALAVEALPDTVTYNDERLGTFRDAHVALTGNYDLSEKVSVQLGAVMHRRTALEKATYKQAHLPHSYTSVAPKVELIWRPKGWHGPVFNAAYERSIRGLASADIAYERWEFDMQHISRVNPLTSVSYRLGCGFYTMIDGIHYFLDYSNFRDNNIPDGWNDEWTGEFTLLSGEWYNLSRFYTRGNLTYESPLMIAGWIPWIGRFFEKERIYASTLFVTHLHPYIELGYGVKTRWLSAGIFMANRNGKYDGFGVKFGFELFRQW